MDLPSTAPASSPAAIPWRMLVMPVSAWLSLLSSRDPWPALWAQWGLLILYVLAAARPLSDLLNAAGIAELTGSAGRLSIWLLLLYFPLNVLLAVAIALGTWLALRLVAVKVSFRDALCLSTYAALPVYLGRCLGFLGFAVVQPLARDSREVWALLYNPFSPGFAGMFEKLSFPWVLATSFDLLGLWSLSLLALGLRHYLKLESGKVAWGMASLVLLWLAALLAVWRGMLAAPVL